MRKVTITLIAVCLIVIIGANLYIKDVDTPVLERIPDPTTLRKTSSGDVVGFNDRFGARSWQGIAYAVPPVGNNRWRAPLEVLPSENVLEALHPGKICPQFASQLSGAGENATPGSVAGDEDCLYLNIWAPPNAANLPVMFWIHGGGNSIGHGGSYSGAALAAQREVVVVTINYRLGIFGWFSHPKLVNGDPADDSGNYGTLDVVEALKWVNTNITEFGGDPDNVTVFGESAGAFDTLAMMASPLAKGLFHKAIVQSGGYRVESVEAAQGFKEEGGHINSSQELVAKLLIEDGTVPDREAARRYQDDISGPKLRDYLYNKPAAEYFRILDGRGFGMVNLPLMFKDGHVLPNMDDEEVFSNPDNHNVVPVILGTNRDEPAIFMVRSPQFTENWLGFLPRLKDEETYKRYVKYGALAWKERGVDRLAQYMSAAGNPHVYAYRFDWDEEPSQFGFDLSTALGAAHGLEIAFAFGDFDGGLGIDYIYPNDENQFGLAKSMTSYWSNFAYTGDPDTGRDGTQVPWLAWGQQDKHSIILDTVGDQGIFMDNQIVTQQSIKAELVADTGFNDASDQCRIYAQNFRGDAFVQAEFDNLNSACKGIDPASLRGF